MNNQLNLNKFVDNIRYMLNFERDDGVQTGNLFLQGVEIGSLTGSESWVDLNIFTTGMDKDVKDLPPAIRMEYEEIEMRSLFRELIDKVHGDTDKK